MEELREGDEVPCAYSGHVLRSDQGTLLRYPSSAMKSRAIRKVDVGEFLKQADIKGATVVDVVVGEHGEVICVKGFTGHPMIQLEVEKALTSWKFKPATVRGIPTAYLGRLEFHLCNIGCGENGPSMTITK